MNRDGRILVDTLDSTSRSSVAFGSGDSEVEAAAAASRAEVERLRAVANEPLVLEAVDSEDEVEDAPQACRIVHETTALGSAGADEACYFVDEGSDSNEESEEAPAYVVDEGSDTE